MKMLAHQIFEAYINELERYSNGCFFNESFLRSVEEGLPENIKRGEVLAYYRQQRLFHGNKRMFDPVVLTELMRTLNLFGHFRKMESE